MLNTTQYTYGVIGASASSKTSAIDLVPAGAPAQVIGGVARRFPAQVSGTANAPAATAVATRPAGPRRRPALVSASHLTRQSLGPAAGCGSRNGAASPRREDL